MSKEFVITAVALFVSWLSLMSFTQRKLIAATRNYSVIIVQHDVDLTAIKMRIKPLTVQTRPTPQFGSYAHPLPCQQRVLAASTSNFDSPDIELAARHCQQDSDEENRGGALLGTSARCSEPGAELQ